jgi:hypothetical protein
MTLLYIKETNKIKLNDWINTNKFFLNIVINKILHLLENNKENNNYRYEINKDYLINNLIKLFYDNSSNSSKYLNNSFF